MVSMTGTTTSSLSPNLHEIVAAAFGMLSKKETYYVYIYADIYGMYVACSAQLLVWRSPCSPLFRTFKLYALTCFYYLVYSVSGLFCGFPVILPDLFTRLFSGNFCFSKKSVKNHGNKELGKRFDKSVQDVVLSRWSSPLTSTAWPSISSATCLSVLKSNFLSLVWHVFSWR